MKRLWLLARRTAQEYATDNCSHMAAAISYYVLFSVIPLTIFTVSIFGFVVRDEGLRQDVADEVVEFLNVEAGTPLLELDEDAVAARLSSDTIAAINQTLDGLPDDRKEELAATLAEGESVTVDGRTFSPDEVTVLSDNVVTDTLRGVSDTSAPLTIVGLVGVAWSASAMFGAVRKSLNTAFGADMSRPIVQQKLVDLGMVLGLGVLLSVSIAGTAGLTTLRSLSAEQLGPLSEQAALFWSVVALVLPAVFSFAVFALVYRYVPNAPSRFSTVWPGALLATVLFELLKNGFALYIANFNSYAGAYGALGGILLFLLWTYLTANILLVGAELAAEYPRVLRGDYDAAPGAAQESATLPERARRTVRGLFVNHPRDREEASGSQRDVEAKG